jgi:hypothetical protein
MIDLNLEINAENSVRNFQVPDPVINRPDIGIFILWMHPALKISRENPDIPAKLTLYMFLLIP